MGQVLQYEDREIEINGMKWRAVKGCKYLHNYYWIYDQIRNPEVAKVHSELSWYRELFRKDLWALVYFVLGIPPANHPFIVQACKDVQQGPGSHTLDLWARDHFKSTIITIAETIQDIIRNPEERIAIFSHKKDVALAFMRAIKETFEKSAILKACYPDILFSDPHKDADKWSESEGLTVKRAGYYKEPTLTSWGLIEGMPTGFHFTKIKYDDVETADLVEFPDTLRRLISRFDLSAPLLSDGGSIRVVGTTFSHLGLLVNLKDKKRVDGAPLFTTRIKEATTDGSSNGPSVFLTEETLAQKRASMSRTHFNAQYLMNPTPGENECLNPNHLVEVLSNELPKNLYKFMSIDPAGERQDRVGDCWAIIVAGVEPFRDDLGASNVFILDACIEVLTEPEALDTVVEMYCKHGRILKLGVEKVGLSSAEIHIANALKAKGRHLSVKSGSIQLLRPGGRPKELRIEQNLAWPLRNGKIFISAAVPTGTRERLKLEMEKFPFWKDDGLDALSYVYDMIKDYRFGARNQADISDPDMMRRENTTWGGKGWMMV